MKSRADVLDKKLMALMSRDGQASVGGVAKALGVTAPTVRSRLKNLLASGLMRIAALVNPDSVEGLTVALVGISVQTHSRMKELMENIADLDNVNWAAMVTGRYDILVEVVLTNGMDELYEFMDRDLARLGRVAASESFVVMKSKRKWILLPQGAREPLDS